MFSVRHRKKKLNKIRETVNLFVSAFCLNLDLKYFVGGELKKKKLSSSSVSILVRFTQGLPLIVGYFTGGFGAIR